MAIWLKTKEDIDNMDNLWKVPFRNIHCEGFWNMIKTSIWIHIVRKIYPNSLDLDSFVEKSMITGNADDVEYVYGQLYHQMLTSFHQCYGNIFDKVNINESIPIYCVSNHY